MVKSMRKRLKTLAVAAATTIAVAGGAKTANAAVGSPARRGVARQVEAVECVQPETVTYVEPVVECVQPVEECTPAPQRCRPVRVERVVRQAPVRQQTSARSASYQHSEYESYSYQSTTSSYQSTSGGYERPMFGRGSRSATPVSYTTGSAVPVQTAARGVRGGRSGTSMVGGIMRSPSVLSGYANQGGRFSGGSVRQGGHAQTGYTRGSVRSVPTMENRRGGGASRGGGRMRGPGGRGRGF